MSDCPHRDVVLRGIDRISPGTIWCNDCQQTVSFVDAFNTLVQRVRRLEAGLLAIAEGVDRVL